MREHRTGERKKERSIKHHVVMLMPFPSEEPLRPRTNPSSTQKRLPEGTRPRQAQSPQRGGVAGKLAIPRPAKPEQDSEAGVEPERSPSGARTEHRIALGRNGQMEPSVAPDLPIRWHSIGSPYGCFCIGQNDPASWAQRPMPHHPVEAHFHTPLERAHVTSEVSQGPRENQQDMDGRPNTQVVQHRSTTAVIVSSQRNSPPQPFSLSTQTNCTAMNAARTEA